MADDAVTPLPEIVTRAEARATGLTRYFTGQPCVNGHLDGRYTNTGACSKCVRLRVAKRKRENPEAVKKSYARQKERYASDPEYREKIRKRAAAWYVDNHDRARSTRKTYYEENKDLMLADNRARWHRYREDPEWVARERKRKVEEYRQHPERRIASWSGRRAREKGAEGKFTTADIMFLLESQKWKCVYCFVSLRDGYEVDHIMPIAKGGTEWPSNLQCLCRPCNRRKSAKDPIVFANEMGRLL